MRTAKKARGMMGHRRRVMVAAAALVCATIVGLPRPGAGAVRAAYFYHYMDPVHLEHLAAAGFNRAVIHWNTDSLGEAGGVELAGFRERGGGVGIEIVPQWALQQPTRLAGRPQARRYTWGDGTVEPEVACPLDSVYWRTALLERAEEFFAADSGLQRIAIDLELYRGSRSHFDAGPCRCPSCLEQYRAGADIQTRDPRRWAGLMGWEEAALERTLTALLGEFATRHPGVEVGVFDLDLDSFVHRALARALARSAVATADYCERSYTAGGAVLPVARARLNALGLSDAPLIGGLWLKRFRPGLLAPAVKSVLERAEGHFIFSTYSLWLEPTRLHGPYTLGGSQGDYWKALKEANAP